MSGAEEDVSDPSDDGRPAIGRVLGGTYRLERELGAGGMGAVFEAAHVRTGRRYAIKVLLPEVGKRADARRRFQREAEAIGALGHANIVAIHDFAEAEDGLAYLVMDLLSGEDLAQRMKRCGAMPTDAVARVVSEIAAGLDAAHERGLAHRDLKPANVFLAAQPGAPERAVVLDFGLVRSFSSVGEIQSRLTVSGVVMGTPLYMSPEQASGLPVDERADISALATLAYEMLAGEPPFNAPTLPALFAQLAVDPPPSIRHRVPELSAEVDATLVAGLAKEPEDRPSSAGAFAAQLAAGLGFAAPIALARTAASGQATPIGNPAQSWPRGAADDAHAPTLATPSGVAPTRAARSGAEPPPPSKAPWLIAAAALGAFAVCGAIGGALLFRSANMTDTVIVAPAAIAEPAPQPVPPAPLEAPVAEPAEPEEPTVEPVVPEARPEPQPTPDDRPPRRPARARPAARATPTEPPAPTPAPAAPPPSAAPPTGPPGAPANDPVAAAVQQNAAGDPQGCLRTLRSAAPTQRVLGARLGCAVQTHDPATLQRVCEEIRTRPAGTAYRGACDSLSPQ